MQPLLQVRDLAVSCAMDGRRQSVAIDDLSFDIAASEAVGLLGESRRGKTTLGLSLPRFASQGKTCVARYGHLSGNRFADPGERDLQKSPIPSWGNILAGLHDYHVLGNCRWMFGSGLALVPRFWFYPLLADALLELFNIPSSPGMDNLITKKLQVAI